MDGIINVYKEEGYTSFDVVAKLRGILKTKKIGHTGTLDPLATGVLPICLGKATKVCAMLTDKSKVYETTFKLGITTDTQDITGKVLNTKEVNVSEDEILNAVYSFVGEIEQLTPMYSARKVDGKKLYEYARAGVVVERGTKKVNIDFIDNVKVEFDLVSMRVGCSAGTYIRTLCNDIGDKLGTGATMLSLKRTKVDVFEIDNSYTLEQIEQLRDLGQIDTFLQDISSLFHYTKKLTVPEELLKYVYNGNKLRVDNFNEEFENDELVRLFDANENFLGIYRNKGEELKVELLYV